MKNLFFLFVLIFVAQICFAEKVEMKVGDSVSYVEKRGAYTFYQNGKQIKFNSLTKTLEAIPVSAEEMKLANGHRRNFVIMIVCGILTFPIGYLILIYPMIKQGNKATAHIIEALKLYNKSLKVVGQNADGTTTVEVLCL